MTAERVSSKERLQLYKLDDRESWWGKVHSMVFWSKDALKSFKIVRQQTRISNPSEDSNLRYTKLRFGGWFLIGNSEFFLVPRWWQDEEISFSVRNNFSMLLLLSFLWPSIWLKSTSHPGVLLFLSQLMKKVIWKESYMKRNTNENWNGELWQKLVLCIIRWCSSLRSFSFFLTDLDWSEQFWRKLHQCHWRTVMNLCHVTWWTWTFVMLYPPTVNYGVLG